MYGWQSGTEKVLPRTRYLSRHAGFIIASPALLDDVRRHRNAVRRDTSSLPNFCSLSPDGEPSEELSADSG